ncbi:ephrin-B2a-like [Coregonus clupeaformis]|uniref:ephrin-B2a-like n=1 Tax=Coregonus clupeaformis TaxID=59861 RepID=UPI001E1C3CC4|nr:ephrin-B2a-like [Coregonus clupeaformis]
MGRYVWWFCLRMLVLNLSPRCSAVILESIYWNSSNTKFSPGQGLVLFPQIGDKMDIVCPRARPGAAWTEPEYYRVYLVTRDQLHSCSISRSDTPLLNCDKPDRDVKFTFKFQEFSPNLWGLEFLKGRDYYITSTSTSSLQGLDNTDGGVCRASMKLVLRVGQKSPTRSPPQHPPDKEPPIKDNDVTNNAEITHSEGDIDTEGGASSTEGGASSTEGGSIGSEVGLFVGAACGSVLLLLVVVVLPIAAWRYRARHATPDRDGHQPTSLPLNALGVTPNKRDGYRGSSDDSRSEPSDMAFPPRPSDSMSCRHYDRVSGDYRHPFYIVQEMPPQSPTNIYYKV